MLFVVELFGGKGNRMARVSTLLLVAGKFHRLPADTDLVVSERSLMAAFI
jgi:hypothetical protein